MVFLSASLSLKQHWRKTKAVVKKRTVIKQYPQDLPKIDFKLSFKNFGG